MVHLEKSLQGFKKELSEMQSFKRELSEKVVSISQGVSKEEELSATESSSWRKPQEEEVWIQEDNKATEEIN